MYTFLLRVYEPTVILVETVDLKCLKFTLVCSPVILYLF